MRLIDADALFKEFEKTGWYNNADRDEIAEEILLQMPTIEAEFVKHGRWVIAEGRPITFYECSLCNDRWNYGAVIHMNYCPNCGAKMRGNTDE